ncbi:MAG: DUF2520 domain-containing protein [Myxococcota bacterium]
MTPDIVLVGPGRLGRTVYSALQQAGWSVQMIGRGQAVPAHPLIWLTVPDRAIEAAARATPRGGVVLHASGATDITPLRPHQPAGSLHPLMTFPGPEVATPPMTDLPAAVAGDPDAIAQAERIAAAMGWMTFETGGDRTMYHAAAVIAGNYATTLLGVAARVLAATGVPEQQAARLLAPLALTSLKNAAEVGPQQALTGPVARGDESVIEKHLRALRRADPEAAQVYNALLRATRGLGNATEG